MESLGTTHLVLMLQGKLRPREAMLIVARPPYMEPRVCLSGQTGTALGPGKVGPRGRR